MQTPKSREPQLNGCVYQKADDHPDFGVPVYWLYLGDQDVVQVAQARTAEAVAELDSAPIAAGGRPIHHIAFRAKGRANTLEHLRTLGVAYIEQQADQQSRRQVFVRDPNDVVVELNFSADESPDRKLAHLAPTLDTA